MTIARRKLSWQPEPQSGARFWGQAGDRIQLHSRGSPVHGASKELEKRVCIRHKFGDHGLNPAVETIILGTFNPGHEANKAEFFYSSPRNQLWSLLPRAFGEQDLRRAQLGEKLQFLSRRRIDFVDLIFEVEVEEGRECDRPDAYIDSRVTRWRDVMSELEISAITAPGLLYAKGI